MLLIELIFKLYASYLIILRKIYIYATILASMFKFFKKEKEPETSLERISRLEKRLTRLEAEILDLATSQDIIRNKVLRKIQSKKEEEKESGLVPGFSSNFGLG